MAKRDKKFEQKLISLKAEGITYDPKGKVFHCEICKIDLVGDASHAKRHTLKGPHLRQQELLHARAENDRRGKQILAFARSNNEILRNMSKN